MKRLAWLLTVLPAFAACGGGAGTTSTFSSGGGGAPSGAGPTVGPSSTVSTSNVASTTGTGGSFGSSGSGGFGVGGGVGVGGTGGGSTVATTSSTSSSTGCGPCPSGYTCGTANGIPVCRSPNGIPLFSHVFIIMMENTSLSTLQTAMTASPSQAPYLVSLAAQYASGSDYHGVTHPSLPNYIALTSGDTQGIACDGDADPTETACVNSLGELTCAGQEALAGCSESNNAKNIADQLETFGWTWAAFGEDMGTPCNITDSGNYAQRHVPFLYYQDIQGNATRCNSHVIDFSSFSPSNAPDFSFIAPNLIDDMHNPDPTTSVNIPDGDTWLGKQVPAILASTAYKDGGLLVVLWDEDDGSGGILGDSDDPIGIFVMSPYAKSGGYVSKVTTNHYSLLATIEDGFGLPYLANAATPGNGVPTMNVAANLADYFPPN